MPTDRLILKMRNELRTRGEPSYQRAKEAVMNENVAYGPVREAIKYFMEKLWKNTQHPALLSLACASVGGRAKDTTLVGASLVLLTGAADIHDDIIDNSLVKSCKQTVLGKFGRDMAILVGDALLLEGMILLNEATAVFPTAKRVTMWSIVKNGFFELGSAEAKETDLKRNWDLTTEDYMALMRMKAALAEVTFRLGVVLGDGSSDELEALGAYGRTLGLLINIRDEFVDTYELNELRNRITNECLPLPVLYAFRNPTLKRSLTRVFGKKCLTDDDVHAAAGMIMDTEEAESLRNELKLMLEKGKSYLMVIKKSAQHKTFTELLNATLAEL
jgi:geranylgeranyl pyrophosphate synthase